MFKIKIKSTNIKELVGKIESIANDGTSQCVIFENKNNTLTLTGFNRKDLLRIRTQDYISIENGKISFDIENLKLLKTLTGDITISQDAEDFIFVVAGKKKIKIQTVPSEYEFYHLNNENFIEKIKMKECNLLETLTKLYPFIGFKSVQEILSFYHFNLEYNAIEVCDSYTIMTRSIADNEKINSGNFLLHNRVYEYLKKILNKKSENPVSIYEGDKYIKILGDEFEYYQYKPNGAEYLNISRIVNFQSNTEFMVKTQDFRSCIEYYTKNVYVKNWKSNKKLYKPLLIKYKNGQVITYTRSKVTVGDSIENGEFVGDTLVQAVDPYLLEKVLKAVDTENTKVLCSTRFSPIKFITGKYTLLLCPMKCVDIESFISEMEEYIS